MNEERSPAIEGCQARFNSNRVETNYKYAHGGVAILTSNDLEIIWTENGNDWSAQACKVGKQRWILISFYIAHDIKDANRITLDPIKKLIRDKSYSDDCIVLGGDANAHIEELDGRRNQRGNLLENFALECGLSILNETEKCEGKFTRGSSVIEYILVNNLALEMVESMHINEKREITDTSDHNLISMRSSG